MARDLTAGMEAELIATLLRPVFFVEINTAVSPYTPIRIWSGYGQKTWDAKTWEGVGNFGSISDIPESTDVFASGIKLSLSGIPSDLIAGALATLNQALEATVWIGCLDSSFAVIADPYEAYAGHVDLTVIKDSADGATIEIAVESDLVDLQRAPDLKYTDVDQQQIYPGDIGFNWVNRIQETNLPWGVSRNVPNQNG